MRYCAWESRLSKCDENGTPTRAHLRAAAKRSVVAMKELEGPRFPEEVAYLWAWFLELRRGIGSGLDGGSLTWVVLDAWARRTQRDPEPDEIDALFQLDITWRSPATLEAA